VSETRQERIHRRLKELGVNRGTASAIAKVLDEETAPRFLETQEEFLDRIAGLSTGFSKALDEYAFPRPEHNEDGAMFTNASIGGQPAVDLGIIPDTLIPSVAGVAGARKVREEEE
jgi:hypothetical protein